MSRQTILELDIDADGLLKRVADIQKSIDQLKTETKQYKDEIKKTDVQIKQQTSVLAELEKQGKQNSKQYAEAKKQIKDLNAANDKRRLKIEAAKVSLKELQEEYRLGQRTVKAYNETLDNQLDIVTKTDGSINQISAALSKNKSIYKKLTKEQRENEAIGGRLLKIIQEQDEKYKDLHKSIGNNNVDVGNYAGQIGGLLEKYTKLGGTSDIISGGFEGVTGSIRGMTKAAWKFIATPFGAVITALTAIGAGVKSWIGYNLEIEKTNGLVRDLTQKSGDAVDSIRIRAEVLKKTFDLDVKEGIESAKSMVENFGISYEEAFDIIEKGAVKGKLSNGMYLESLKEYPIQFKNAGFSAKEFAQIVETGIDLSIYQDKLPDAIKEFGLSISEATKPAQDALRNAFGAQFTKKLFEDLKSGSISTKEALSRISIEAEKVGLNSQQAQQLTADLFKGAGEDAGGALKIFKAVNIALNDQQKPLTEIQKLRQEELKTNKELKGVYKQLFASNSKGFKLLIERGKIFATKTLLGILKAGVNVYNWFVDLNNTSGTFSAILTAIGITAKSVFEIIGILVKSAVESFKGLGNVIKGVFSLDWDTFKKGLEQSFTATAISGLKDKVVNDVKQIRDAFSGKDKMEKMTLEDLTSDKPAKGETNTKDKTAIRKSENIDKLIKKQNEELKLYIANNEEKHKSLDKLLKYEQEVSEKRLEIERQRLKKGEISQTEYQISVLNSQKELAKKTAEITIEHANKELDLYIAQNRSKIENEKILTGELVNLEIERLQAINSKRSEILEAQREADMISEQDYLIQKIQLHKDFLNQKKTVESEFKEQQKEIEQANYDNELEIRQLRGENDYTLQLEALERNRVAEIAIAEKKGIDTVKINKKYELKKKQINDAALDAQISSVAAGFGDIKQLFGESTAAGKAAAIAETTVNTYKSATAAYAAVMAAGGPLGVVLAPIAAAAAVAAGLANVKKITSVNTKFQEGGLLEGKSHAQGGIPFTINGESGFEAEGGEYIVNRKATEQFLPLLEHINRKYKIGAMHSGVKTFQMGGILQRGVEQTKMPQIDYDRLATQIGSSVAEANKNLPRPVVAVEDINTAQDNYSEIISAADY